MESDSAGYIQILHNLSQGKKSKKKKCRTTYPDTIFVDNTIKFHLIFQVDSCHVRQEVKEGGELRDNTGAGDVRLHLHPLVLQGTR